MGKVACNPVYGVQRVRSFRVAVTFIIGRHSVGTLIVVPFPVCKLLKDLSTQLGPSPWNDALPAAILFLTLLVIVKGLSDRELLEPNTKEEK